MVLKWRKKGEQAFVAIKEWHRQVKALSKDRILVAMVHNHSLMEKMWKKNSSQ
jgi:hypothetical protein